jgi:hypothetical protein
MAFLEGLSSERLGTLYHNQVKKRCDPERENDKLFWILDENITFCVGWYITEMNSSVTQTTRKKLLNFTLLIFI